jgi:sulfur-oxidizing protein SoxX
VRVLGFLGAIVLLGTSLGCEVGPKSGLGLRLPEGDISKGKTAFTEIGCPQCHKIQSLDLPRPNRDPEITVILGGQVRHIETYGELVTSIINPTHEVSRRAPRVDGKLPRESQMENFNDMMTVAQLIDLVAFLQSRYELLPEPMYVP